MHFVALVYHVTKEHDDFADNQLHDTSGITVWSIENSNALLGARKQIDLIGTDTICTNGQEMISVLEDFWCNTGPRADAEDKNIFYLFIQFFLREAFFVVSYRIAFFFKPGYRILVYIF